MKKQETMDLLRLKQEWEKWERERRMWQCLFLLCLFVYDSKADKTEWSTMSTIWNGTTSITKKEERKKDWI